MTLNLINNVVENVDEGFDKIKVNVDEGFDKIKVNVDEGFDKIKVNVDEGFDKITYKIMTNMDTSMKIIIETTTDPKMIVVAKTLSRHSPKIALLIASYALAGIPYGTLITQIAGFIINQMGNSGQTSSDRIENTLNTTTVLPVIEKLLTKSYYKSQGTPPKEMKEIEKQQLRKEDSLTNLSDQLVSITERLKKLENEKQIEI